MVFEEDTNLIMTIDDIIEYREEHPIRLFTEVMRTGKHLTGSLVINSRNWYAVVLNIDHDPICQTDWIIQAYQKIHGWLVQDETQVAALHLLGCINGGISILEGMSLCLGFVVQEPFTPLEELIIIVPDQQVKQARQSLKRF